MWNFQKKKISNWRLIDISKEFCLNLRNISYNLSLVHIFSKFFKKIKMFCLKYILCSPKRVININYKYWLIQPLKPQKWGKILINKKKGQYIPKLTLDRKKIQFMFIIFTLPNHNNFLLKKKINEICIKDLEMKIFLYFCN